MSGSLTANGVTLRVAMSGCRGGNGTTAGLTAGEGAVLAGVATGGVDDVLGFGTAGVSGIEEPL
jgi:hypothetical protein